ncbi:MAG: hypothetical protein R3E95_02625 [Thiolinea sp.]
MQATQNSVKLMAYAKEVSIMSVIHQEGRRLIIEAIPQTPLLSFLEHCEPLVLYFSVPDDLPPLDDVVMNIDQLS